MRKAAKRFKLKPKWFCKWRDKIDDTKACNTKKRRLEGADRPYLDKNVKEKLLEWKYSRRNRMIRVSGKLIMTEAKDLYDDTHEDDPTNQDAFVAGRDGFKRSWSVMDYLSSASYHHITF